MAEKSQIAAFIDYENFVHDQAPDIGPLKAWLEHRGRVLVARAYADWGRFAKHKRRLTGASIELVELPSHSERGKNSSDMRLALDAHELGYTQAHIDTFVIVSGDSDFIPLLRKLKKLGKVTVVISTNSKVNKLLRELCDEFLRYSELTTSAGLPKVKAAPVKTTARPQEPPPGHVDEEARVSAAFDLLRQAVIEVGRPERPARGSSLKSVLVKSGFDEKSLGYPRFSKFLEAAQNAGVVRLKAHPSGDSEVSLIVDASPRREPDNLSLFRTRLRKRGIRVLRPREQRAVLEAFLHYASRGHSYTNRAMLDALQRGSLKGDEHGEALSRKKIMGVIRVLAVAGCLENNGEDDARARLQTLRPRFREIAPLRVMHDACLRSLADEYDITLSPEEWAELLG